MSTGTAKTGAPAALVALVALVVTVILTVRVVSDLDWDPTVFVGFGVDATPTTEYGEERLGEVYLRDQQGHDGKYFFVQANDPWLHDPAANAEILDYPIYRSQRMFYPLLAGGLGLLSPEAIVWNMVLVNVIAMALGTWGTAKLALRLGGSAWWGLAFVGNVGLMFALANDGAGIVATAFAVWGVLMLYEDRMAPAAALLAASALTREVMIVCAAGAAIWLWTERRRRAAAIVGAVPVGILGLWEIYLRVRLGPDDAGVNAIGAPFVGIIEAFPTWTEETLVLVAGFGFLALLAIYVLRWFSTRTALGWSFVGFIPLSLILTEKVWRELFDFTRAIAPLITAAVLLIFVETSRTRPHGASTTEQVTTSSRSVGVD
jgi:hypothetical protein